MGFGEGSGPGRPTLRTPQIEGVIVRALERGLGYKLAADLAGIALATLRSWRKADEAFSATLRRADVNALEIGWAAVIRAAQSEDDGVAFRAGSWIIERKGPPEEEMDEEQLADIAARVFAYGQAMRGTVPVIPASNGHDYSA